MRQVRQFIFALSLTLLLTISALAGELQTPSTVNKPTGTILIQAADGQTQAPGAAIKVADPTMELALNILTSLLSLI
jgi:hypothetical protein